MCTGGISLAEGNRACIHSIRVDSIGVIPGLMSQNRFSGVAAARDCTDSAVGCSRNMMFLGRNPGSRFHSSSFASTSTTSSARADLRSEIHELVGGGEDQAEFGPFASLGFCDRYE